LSIRFLLPVAAAVVACLGLAGVAYAQSPSPSASPSATAVPPAPTPAPPVEPAQCPDVSISAKATGSTVSVTLVPSTVNIKPPSAGDLNSFHLHYFVDLDPATIIVPGQPLPPPGANPSIIHSPELSMTFSGLTAGDHTVWVVMGRLNHVPCAGGVQAVVKFTVPKAPGTGTGPATGDGTGAYTWAIVAGVALLATGAVAGARAIKR
jgi:hypothetical protein